MRSRNLTIWIVLVTVGCLGNSSNAGQWTTIDFPAPGVFTSVTGVSGDNLVGRYYNPGEGNDQGFIYDGTTFTSLNYPGAGMTAVQDISGNKIVGVYAEGSNVHSFLYDGTTWTTIDKPGAYRTHAYGIDGNNITGAYRDVLNGPLHAFIYDGSTWTTLDYPGATYTWSFNISGSNLVGQFIDANDLYRGFVYNGTTWTALEMPGMTETYPYGIDGNNIVGYCVDRDTLDPRSQGFLYDGSTWTTLDYPGPGVYETQAFDIEGYSVTGCYMDVSGVHGFVYTVPEPATLLLLGLGAVMLGRRSRL